MPITSAVFQTPGTCLRNLINAYLDQKKSEEIDKWPLDEAVWSTGELMEYLMQKVPASVGPGAQWSTYDQPPTVNDLSTGTSSIQDWVNAWCVTNSITYSYL